MLIRYVKNFDGLNTQRLYKKNREISLNLYFKAQHILAEPWTQRAIFFAFVFCLFSPLFAGITDESMKDAVQDLQSDLFGDGWCLVGKIAAFATGCVFAVSQMSGLPFAGGIGVAAGIHFAQKYTSGAAGCLF